MPLLFSSFCVLLSELESQKLRDPPFLPKDLDQRYKKTIISWFNKHQHIIHASDTNGVAILSTLFPEKRTDRVYWIKEKALANILKRGLGLGTGRKKLLDEWNVPGKGDLGSCVERAMRQTDDGVTRNAATIMVDEIDEVLAEIGHRGRGEHGPNTQTMLSNIYRRLHSHEGKWLTRLILKDFSPVILPCDLVLRCFHFLLPDLLRVQDSFDAAMDMFQDGLLKNLPPRPNRIYETALRYDAAKHLRPRINVKIGRALFQKARSLKHCVNMCDKRFMSVQRKYDGEYCQVHIDLSRGQNCIKIFAKSGKDATGDRAGVHDAIKRSLRIGQEDCQFKSQCVLDGELLVYSDKENKIMDFNRIRRYVSRSGAFIGIERDSPPRDDEHLMIMFHDIILVDNNFILTKRHQERYQTLIGLIRQIEGHAQIRDSTLINFNKSAALTDLRLFFARAISKDWEGLVLKPDDEAYFSFEKPNLGCMSSAWIKLKKDYIAGLGDTADFAIIGASSDGREASSIAIPGLKWTSFHVGCLMNKEDVCRFGAKPLFREIDVLHPPNINKVLMERLNRLAYFQEVQYERGQSNEFLHVKHDQTQLRKMTHFFKQPLVVELMGASFEKPSGVTYYTLRFPRLQKIHEDRVFKDAVSFDELQQLAQDAKSVPEDQQSQTEREWLSKIKASSTGGWSQQTSSEDSYCTTERSSETSPWRKNVKWSVTPTGSSAQHDCQGSPTPTKRMSVPMVRMDSGEMRLDEKRLGSGEVIATSSAVAIPTSPPTFSQRDKINSPSKKRKAPSDAREADLNLPVPPRKRFVHSPSKAFPGRNSSIIVAPASSLPPLNVNNNAFHFRQSPNSNRESRKRKISLPPIDEESTAGEASGDDALEILSPPPKRTRILSSPSNGSSSNPIYLRDSEEGESQDSLPSFVSTDYEGEPLNLDSSGIPQFYLESRDLPLSGLRSLSPDLYHPEETPSMRPHETVSEMSGSSRPFAAEIVNDSTMVSSNSNGPPNKATKSTHHKELGSKKQQHAPAHEQRLEADGKDATFSSRTLDKVKAPQTGQRKGLDPAMTMIRKSVTHFKLYALKLGMDNMAWNQRDGNRTSAAQLCPSMRPVGNPVTPNNLASPDVPATTETSQTPNVATSADNHVLPANTESLGGPADDSQSSAESFCPEIPPWYPHIWPAPPDFLSIIPDPTVLYTLSYTSVSISALTNGVQLKVAYLLDVHFPKTFHTHRLISFIHSPAVVFPNTQFLLPPLLKIILFDSQSPEIRETFNKTASKVIRVLGRWKRQGRLLHTGKILFLDYRVVGASVRLIMDDVQAHHDGQILGPGPLEESRWKRELLGRLWRENFWLGCAAWGAGVDGEVEMKFGREKYL